MNIRITAVLALAVLPVASAYAGPGLFPTLLAGNTTGVADSTFTGPPDGVYYGLGGQTVTYDFGADRITDGSGPDLNVYEVDWGKVEFTAMTVAVSLNGTDFFDVTSTIGPAVDVTGDELHADPAFRQSFDLGPSGLSAARYVRIDGDGTGAAGLQTGFDLDAVGAVNFSGPDVPEPAALGLLLLPAALLLRLRRR